LEQHKIFSTRLQSEPDARFWFRRVCRQRVILAGEICACGVGTIRDGQCDPAAIHKLYRQWKPRMDADAQQSKLNVVREVFSSKEISSMIAALKQRCDLQERFGVVPRAPPLVETYERQASCLLPN